MIQRQPSPAQLIQKKLSHIKLACIIIFLVITTRLFQLQIIHNNRLLFQSQKNFLRFEKTPPPRGNILDRHGKLLVTNRPITAIYWQGTGKHSLQPSQADQLTALEKILATPVMSDATILKPISNAERRYKKVLLAHDISNTQLGQIKERFPNSPNICIEHHFERHYPYGTYASHLVGYLGQLDVERVGRMGLEQLFDLELQGVPGTILKQINSLGKSLATHEIKKHAAGNTIQTTLDSSLQQIAETVFPPDYAGTIIVMDPYDGGIRALTSRPSFDPSIFLKPLANETWQHLQESKPFLNRAFQACYPPGSIFKLITISAALEQGIIPIDSLWECNGALHFHRRKYWCHKRSGHGILTTSQAVAESCNILFYEIGKKISIDTLAAYAEKFGLGQKTGILFSEKTGLIPSKHWKEETIGEPWWPGETLSAAIGQSYILTTPIQIACMISSIMTGYRVQPRILLNEECQAFPLNISFETIDFLRQSMRAVVTKGTGRRINKVADFDVYAKTSTAQTSDFKKRKLGKDYLEHGWFVAHLAYKDHRPLTLVVLIEHAGSARLATVTARNFLIAYKKLLESQQVISS